MAEKYIYCDASGIENEATFKAVHWEVYKDGIFPYSVFMPKRLSRKKMEKAFDLNLNGKKRPVENLQFLRFFPGLEMLSIKNMERPLDLLPLANLKKINMLFLEHIRVPSLSPLAECNSLTELSLDNVSVDDGDYSALARMSNLQFLEINGGKMTDISWMAGMNQLKMAEIYGSTLEDISVVYTLPNLNLFESDDHHLDEEDLAKT